MANNIINKPTTITYWQSYNNNKTFYHFGSTEPNQITENKLDAFETYTDKDEAIARAKELGIDAAEFLDAIE